ncbi:hypothetical protein [Polaromonas sp. CG9_12]|nr:P-type E1-E2 ATPase [Polaromonas sp. CG_9.11]CDS50035.1 hypothetical protein [Polaromonas sp. CG9_12]
MNIFKQLFGRFLASRHTRHLFRRRVILESLPKESTAPALTALAENGITVKVLTGDNALVTAEVCRQVGLQVARQRAGPAN